MVTRIQLNNAPAVRMYFREWRKAAGMTQQQVADRLGTTAATISRIENGKLDFSGKFLAAFAFVVGCPNPNDPVTRPPGQLSIDSMFSKVSAERRLQVHERARAMVQLLLNDESDKSHHP